MTESMLGFGFSLSLAGAAMGGNDLVRTARPIMDNLAERTHETVNLGVLSGDAVVYINTCRGSIVSVNWVGQRTPLRIARPRQRQGVAPVHERCRTCPAAEWGAARALPPTLPMPPCVRARRSVPARGYAQTMGRARGGPHPGRRAWNPAG